MTDTDSVSVQPSADPETDPILQDLIAQTRLLEGTNDAATIASVRGAILSRCMALGIDFDAVERRYLGVNTDTASVQPSADLEEPSAESEDDPILQGLIALVRLLEKNGDTETIVSVHGAIMSRCMALGLDFDAVERSHLGMDFETDFPDFN